MENFDYFAFIGTYTKGNVVNQGLESKVIYILGYNSKNELQYRGRIAEMKNLNFVNNKNDLLEAMIEISKTQNGPKNQFASAGCSVKWK